MLCCPPTTITASRRRIFNLPLSVSARPGGSGVSFGHSAGGGGDGSARGAEGGALETWFEGLDEGLAEHSCGCM